MKEIVQDGASVLREVAIPVPEKMFGSAELAKLIADMAEALDRYPEGVAIAAPQVGVSWRLFIVRKDRTLPVNTQGSIPPRLDQTLKAEVEVYINPEIVKTSRRKLKSDEGCLSVHGVYGTTNRHERATIRARGEGGSHFRRDTGGLMAQIFEHEIDHLNGILFIDHAKRLVRVPRELSHQFAYFGTPKVASDTLAILLERGFVPSLVVTAPDALRGRGLTLAQSETRILARARGIPVLTPEKLDKETIAAIGAFGCRYAIVVAYGKIFPESLINAFPLGVLNVHYSLLPKYRGATPLETALLAGEKETGVTIQKMTREVDAGDILAQETVDIRSDDTARELRPRLVETGARLLADTLPAYIRGAVTPLKQDASQATRAHKIKKEDGLISLPAGRQGSPKQHLENWNKYRAYADSIGTYFFENGKRMKVVRASLTNGECIIERVIPEGKREMAYAARRKASR